MNKAPLKAKPDCRAITANDLAIWGGQHFLMLLNAVRLLDDARVLRKARRYASATALTILSLEEVGKFALSHEYFKKRIAHAIDSRRGRKFTHQQKQKAAAEIVKGTMGVHEISALVGLAGFEFTLAPITTENKPNLSIGKVISRIRDKHIEKLIESSKLGQHLKFLIYLMKGRYENVKQQCFYVDVKKDGTIAPESIVINRSTCDGAMRTAEKAIRATKVGLRRYSRTVLRE